MMDSRIMDVSILTVSRYSRIQFYEISWQYIKNVKYEIKSLSSRLDCSIIILNAHKMSLGSKAVIEMQSFQDF